MKDINIVIDSQTHKVQFPDNFLGLNAENLQGNINFTFTNGFVNGIARLELSIDCESGFIPNLQNTGDSYTLPILSSLLTSDNIVMQLVIEQTDLITYKLTTDTSINNQKTYYTRSGVEGEYVYTIVENPKVADIGTYYEAQIPIFKTHIFNMTVGESINAVNTIPDDYPTWIDTLNSLVGQVNAKIIEMNQALAEVDNLDITATKEGTTVTITITRKDGSQQVVTITDGKDGVGIVKIEKTGTNLLVDTYTIYYTDDSTSTFQVKNGRGIVSIDKTDTNILTDTYTITYNDNTTSTFYVVNGNGVDSIVKIGTSGLIDTYRISYTNGEYYDYQVANGNGIDNIQKTSTSGLVDTYTITYTNGTTTTFQITNGEDGEVTQAQLDETNRAIDYYKSTLNALPKVEGEGTSLTLDDTAEAPMPMKLGPNTEQASTTGKNKMPYNIYNASDDRALLLKNLVLPAGTYTISFDLESKELGTNSSFAVLLGLYYENTSPNDTTLITIDSNTTLGRKSVIFTTTDNVILNSNSNIRINSTSYNNGARAKLNNIQIESGSTATDYEPYTGGIPAPNPEFPMNIHTISGDNEIKVVNINLWDEKWELGKLDSNTANATFGQPVNSTTQIRAKNYVQVNPNTNYHCFFGSLTGHCFVISYDEEYKAITSWGYKTFDLTNITTPNNAKYIRFYCNNEYGTTYKNDIAIIKGNNGTYTPHEEQSLPLNLGDLEYCKIGDYEDEFVIPSGSNLFAKTQWTSLTVEGNTRWGYKLQTIENNFYISEHYKTNNTNFYLYKYDNSTATMVKLISSTPQLITNDGSEYYILDFSTSVETIAKPHYDGVEFMVSYNYITEYEPYNDGKWYLKKNIVKVVLNGSESWSFVETYQGISQFETSISNVSNTPQSAIKILSNYFKGTAWTDSWTKDNSITLRNGKIRIMTSKFDNASDLQTWLGNNNVIAYLVEDTPEYILLNDTLQSQLTEIYNWLVSYQDQTNISQVNNDLPFIINTITCYDLNKLLTRVEVLESEV